jgi:hypothetical protein
MASNARRETHYLQRSQVHNDGYFHSSCEVTLRPDAMHCVSESIDSPRLDDIAPCGVLCEEVLSLDMITYLMDLTAQH